MEKADESQMRWLLRRETPSKWLVNAGELNLLDYFHYCWGHWLTQVCALVMIVMMWHLNHTGM